MLKKSSFSLTRALAKLPASLNAKTTTSKSSKFWWLGLAFYFGAGLMLFLVIIPRIYGLQAIPIHYNVHIGVDQIAAWWMPVVWWLIWGLLLLINFLLYRRFHREQDAFLQTAILSFTIIGSILALTAGFFQAVIIFTYV